MPSIAAPGIGSGLDVQSIVSQLMAVERQPLQRLEFKQSQYESQISACGQLSSSFGTFQSAIEILDTDTFGGTAGDSLSIQVGDDVANTISVDLTTALQSNFDGVAVLLREIKTAWDSVSLCD